MKKTLLSLFSIFCVSIIASSQTTFGPKQLISTTGDQPYTIASGLIDNDAFIDIVAANYGATHEIIWYKNNGDGTFAAQPLVTNTLSGIGGIKLVDLNNDTYLDILASAYTNDKLVWFPNDGNGNFNTLGEQIISSSISGASGIAVGTIDSGATIDVAVTSYDGNNVVWFSNDGSGIFTGPNTIDLTLTAPGVINLKDIDGDSDLDALILTGIYASTNVIEIFRNDGSGGFTKDATSVSTGEDFLFNGSFEDLDGDANLDILVTELDFTLGAGSFLWFEEDGAGGYTRTVIATTIGNPSVAQTKDLDDDGLKDIVLSSGASGAGNDIVWFKNNGGGSYGAEQVIDNTQSQAYVFTVNDFDNDGDLDIASCSYNEDQLNWFENQRYVLGLSDEEFNNISIYPNPTKDILNFEGFTSSIAVSIFDLLGKSVLNKTLNTNETLDVSKLTNGLYSITINGTFASKFIKE